MNALPFGYFINFGDIILAFDEDLCIVNVVLISKMV